MNTNNDFEKTRYSSCYVIANPEDTNTKNEGTATLFTLLELTVNEMKTRNEVPPGTSHNISSHSRNKRGTALYMIV